MAEDRSKPTDSTAPWPAGGGEMAGLIRAHDWAATPLGPIEEWPQSLKTAADIVLGSGHAMMLAWGPERTLLYNDAYTPMLGKRHPDALGRPFREAWPEIWDEIEPLVAQVFAGETVRFEDLPLAMTRHGYPEETWWTFSYSPVCDETGAVAGLINVTADVTPRKRAEAAETALRESEERLGLAVEVGGVGHWALDLATNELSTSALCRRNFGRPADEPFAYDDLRASIHPDDKDRQQRTVAAAIEERSAFELEYRLFTPAGEQRWIDIRGRFEGGDAERLVGVSLDITERKRAEQALRESEKRLAAEVSGGRLLQRLSTRLIPEQSPEALYDQILDTALELMGADAVSIQLLEDGGKRLRRVATRNLHPDSTEYWTWVDASHASTCGQALARNERVMVEDIEAEPDLAGTGDLKAFRASGTRAVQSSPLLTRTGRPIGMISTHWRAPRAFEESDFGLFDILARQVADLFERSRNEATLRESEERQVFLLKLSDALRAEPDADAIALFALRTLTERLRLDRCYIAEYRLDEDTGDIAYQVGNDRVPPLPESVRLSDFPEALDIAAGRTLVIDNVGEAEFLSDADKRNMQGLGMGALVTGAARKGENAPLFAIVAVSADPRDWTPGEIALIEEVNERTWAAIERARAEAALVASEEKYRVLFETMRQGYGEVELLRDEDGRAIDVLYLLLNPAFERFFGIPVADAVGRTAREVLVGIEDYWFEAYDRVSRSGESERIELELGTSGGCYALEIHPRGGDRLLILYDDITERKRAEQALHESEEWQAYLLRLSDALRPLTDAVEIIGAATRLLGEGVGASRAYYAEWPPGTDYVEIRSDYFAPGLPSLVGRYSIEFFRYTDERFRDGRTWIVQDAADGTIPAEERDYCLAHGVAAWVDVPLVKDGTLQAALFLVQDAPRRWDATEIALAEATAERTWAALERARAEAALRESEDKFRTVFESMDEGFLVHEIIRDETGRATDLRMLEANPALTRVTGLGRDMVGKLGSEFLSDLESYWLDTFDRVARTGAAERLENYNQATDRWYNVHISRVSGYDNRVAVVFDDVTARKRTEQTLRASEAHLRLIQDSLDEYAIITLDRAGLVTSWSEGAERLLGYGEEEAVGMDGRAIFTPEDRAKGEPEREIRNALGKGRAANERWHMRKDGSRFWGSGAVLPLRDGDGDGEPRLVKIMRDETARREIDERLRESESRLRLLLSELQHRVRNLLGIVRSLVRRSSHGYVDLEEFLAHLIGRLDALGRTQIMITRGIDARVDLETLIRDELAAQTDREELFDLEGPEVALSAKAAEVLSLALHELATNSLKYGVIGERKGSLDVNWWVTERNGRDWLDLHWRERGSSTRPVRQRVGFGTELIEQRVPYELEGEGALEITATGVEARIGFPLTDHASLLETGAPRKLR